LICKHSQQFLGGVAHKGILKQANNVWKFAGSRIKQALFAHPGYTLTITGHSLGAGVACLLTMKLYSENLLKDVVVKCYAYACPPVFYPIQNIPPQAKENTICYIHDVDVVPRLSIYSLCQLCERTSMVRGVETRLNRAKIMLGFISPDSGLEEIIISSRDYEASETVPKLLIPSSKNVWLTKDGETEHKYRASIHPPEKYRPILVDPHFINYHFPNYYENAFHRALAK